MFNRKFIKTLSNTLLFSLLVSSLSMIPVQHTEAGTSINLDFTARTGKNGGGDSSPAYIRQSATDAYYKWSIDDIHETVTLSATVNYNSKGKWQVDGKSGKGATTGGYVISIVPTNGTYTTNTELDGRLASATTHDKTHETIKQEDDTSADKNSDTTGGKITLSLWGKANGMIKKVNEESNIGAYAIAPIYSLSGKNKKDAELISGAYSKNGIIGLEGVKSNYKNYVISEADIDEVGEQLENRYKVKMVLQDSKGKTVTYDTVISRVKKFLLGTGKNTVAETGTAKTEAMNKDVLLMKDRYEYNEDGVQTEVAVSEKQENYNEAIMVTIVCLIKYKYGYNKTNLLNTVTSSGLHGQLNKFIKYLQTGKGDEFALFMEPLVEISCIQGVSGHQTFRAVSGTANKINGSGSTEKYKNFAEIHSEVKLTPYIGSRNNLHGSGINEYNTFLFGKAFAAAKEGETYSIKIDSIKTIRSNISKIYSQYTDSILLGLSESKNDYGKMITATKAMLKGSNQFKPSVKSGGKNKT